jgi:hypothetical protein
MKSPTPVIQNIFSQSQFDKICAGLRTSYETTVESPLHPNLKGGIVEFNIFSSHGNLTEAANEYARLLSVGYEPFDVISPLSSFVLVSNAGQVQVRLTLKKPREQLEAELDAMFELAKQQYIDDLEVAQAQEVERQIDIALQAAARREAAKVEAARKAIADKVTADMKASRETLRAELIANGKLNSAGESQ